VNKTEFQTFINWISDCWIQRGFESWADHVSLPFSTITLTGRLNNEDLASLRGDWGFYCQNLGVLKITQIIRKVIIIEGNEEDTLIGTYQTQMSTKGRRMVGPYTSFYYVGPRRRAIAGQLHNECFGPPRLGGPARSSLKGTTCPISPKH
jgi:hypothetical protein